MEIELKISNYRCFSDENPAVFKIRDSVIAFVGPNNAGKSTVLKLFFELRNLFRDLSSKNGLIAGLDSGNPNNSFSKQEMLDDHTDMFCRWNTRDMQIELTILDDDVPDVSTLEAMQPAPELSVIKRFKVVVDRNLKYRAKILDAFGQVAALHEPSIFHDHVIRTNSRPRFDAEYIMETFRKLGNNLYIGAFRNLVNIGTKENYFDITIGQKFIEQWNEQESGKQNQGRSDARKIVQEIQQLFNFNQLHIAASHDKQNMVVDIDGESYLLTELGSGMAHFIMVLITCAIKKPDFILIDEPELNLHPSIQLSFLTAIASKAKTGVLYSTHSIGLARSSADLIYTVKRSSTQKSSILKEFEATENVTEFLGEMSYSGYEDLGFQKILLVEGTTEVKTIQQFLRQMNIDHEVVILPLGGRSLINGNVASELRELRRISDSVYAVIDSERPTARAAMAENVQDFKTLCNRIGISCCVLERRATENYFTDKAVKATFGSEYRSLDPYEKLSDLGTLSWQKRNNWRVARNMDLEDITGTDLYEFLQSLQ